MGEENEKKTYYFKPKIKWYKKLWYIITGQKHKIPEPIPVTFTAFRREEDDI